MTPPRARWRPLTAILLGLAPTPAAAAEIRIVDQSDHFNVIAVSGEFELSDGEKFASVAGKVAKGVVVFNSPGGSLLAGLQMGKLIRLKHLATAVSTGDTCASACALAWLAGQPLLVQEGARIGFHAASVVKAGVRVGANVGNALVGAYLSELGLSYEAIIYVETADPDDITWLTLADARKIGLRVRFLPAKEHPDRPTASPAASPPEAPSDAPAAPSPRPPEPAAPPQRLSLLDPELTAPERAPNPAPAPDRPIEDIARSFVAEYFAHWSETGQQALTYFASAYAEQVAFYGHNLDRDTVLAGKRSFTSRWPARVYSTRPDSIHVFCNHATQICTVSGIVDWDCRNTAGNSTRGTANFVLTASLAGPRPQISAENGSVVTRSSD